MRRVIGCSLALCILLVLPASGEAAARGGRLGFGYSLYPMADGLGTLRYDSYKFFFEGGFRLVDMESLRSRSFQDRVQAVEYYGIPVDMGGLPRS
jgi:hypothetical protein